MAIEQLTPEQKDFVVEKVFSLLWQTIPEADWESVSTSEEMKKLSHLFDLVDQE